MWVFIATSALIAAGFALRACIAAPAPAAAPPQKRPPAGGGDIAFAGRRLASIVVDGRRVRVPIATISAAAAAEVQVHEVLADGSKGAAVPLVQIPRGDAEVAVMSPVHADKAAWSFSDDARFVAVAVGARNEVASVACATPEWVVSAVQNLSGGSGGGSDASSSAPSAAASPAARPPVFED
jgi:hypothetical protein